MSVLYGPDGKPLVGALRHPQGLDIRLAVNKKRVEGFLRVVSAGDKAGGRGEWNWSVPPRKCLTQALVNRMRSRGIVAYVTPGQFIVADLTGPNPRIRQRRPLAERFIELVEEEGHA